MDEATLTMPAYRPPTWEDQQLPVVAGVRCTHALAGRPDTWRGTTSAGQSVDVTVIALSTEPAVRSAGLAALAGLGGLQVAGMPQVLAVEPARLGVAVIARAVDGPPMGDIARLPPRTVAGAGLTLAAALGALHRAGRVFGADVSELGAELRLGADGTAWLCWHGWVQRRLAGLLVARSPAGDVTAARALLRRFVTTGGDRSARRLARALEPRARTATELARNLSRVAGRRPHLRRTHRNRPRAHRITPSRGQGTARTGKGSSSDRMGGGRRLAHRIATVIAATIVALATVAVGWASGRWGLSHSRGAPVAVRVRPSDATAQQGSATETETRTKVAPTAVNTTAVAPTPVAPTGVGPPTASAATSTSAPAASCLAALSGLDLARAAAFEGRGLVTGADLAGSSEYFADAATVAELQAAALHSDGPRPEVLRESVASLSGGLCALTVTDQLPAYHYLDSTGHVVATAPARGAQTWRMVLVSTTSGWRIASVTQGT